jgi:hypothetical protein
LPVDMDTVSSIWNLFMGDIISFCPSGSLLWTLGVNTVTVMGAQIVELLGGDPDLTSYYLSNLFSSSSSSSSLS